MGALFLFNVGHAQQDDAPKSQTTQTISTIRPADSVAAKEPASEPFAFGDFSWLNGTSRKTSPPAFDSKYFTGDVTFDFNYTHSFNNPIDNTVVGSTALARNNELQLSFMGVGGDIHVNNVRGRIMMQFGTRSTVVPRNDGSSYKGQYDLQTIYRYISEAYAGYHWDVWHGINLDAGIFMSYIGLFSYNNFENWGYQPSYTSDNTPWFFNGLRLQTFPSDKLKLELWLVNGWQTFGQWHETRAGGYQFNLRPSERLSINHSTYAGKDQPLDPHAVRLYTDNFVQWQWLKGGPVKSSALALVADVGWEHRSVSPSGAMTGGSLSNRVEFDERWAACARADIFYDRTQALVIQLPLGSPYSLPDKGAFLGGGLAATFDFSPSPWVLFRLEYSHRWSNIPYFSGPGGITGPGGVPPVDAAAAASFTPDLRKSDDRVVANATLRL
jgi:Putative beta-barrel porin-2, OmpL-like. bbp2